MSHSHVCCLIHIVFSTAERRPTIRDELHERLHAYLGGIARENGILTLAIGGAAEHVHLLLSLPSTVSVAKAVQLLKSGSSKWIHEQFPASRGFAWQEGYGAFSVGVSQKAATVKYILTQAEHHKKIGFADEFKKFLAAHGIEE
jgi:putative transposase